MRHSNLFAKHVMCSASNVSSSFIHGGGPSWHEVPAPQVQLRMLILGAIEALPIFAGAGFASYFESTIPHVGSVTAGVVLSVLLCWLLRNRTPPTVIHGVPKTIARTAQHGALD